MQNNIGIVSVFVAIVLVCACNGIASARDAVVATIEGVARAKDGDGVLFGRIEIRLNGIAAPEDNHTKREPGGPEATANLARLVNGLRLRCDLDGSLASSNRPVGVCFKPDGSDIGEHQVRAGHARDCPAFSKGRYAGAEQDARAQGKNLSAIYPLPRYCTGGQ